MGCDYRALALCAYISYLLTGQPVGCALTAVPTLGALNARCHLLPPGRTGIHGALLRGPTDATDRLDKLRLAQNGLAFARAAIHHVDVEV